MQITSTDVALLRKRIFSFSILMIPFLALMMFFPLLTAGVLGILLAIILAPFSAFICRKTGWKQDKAALIIVVMITAGLVMPVSFASWKLIDTSTDAVSMVADADKRTKLQKHLSDSIAKVSERYPGQKQWLDKTKDFVDNSQAMLLGGAGLSKMIKGAGGTIAKFAKNTLVAMLFFAVQFIVVMKIMHHILSHGSAYSEKISIVIPIERKRREKILIKLKNAVIDIAYGMFLNGVIQGGVGIVVVLGYLLIFNPINPWYYVVIVATLFVGSVFTLPVSAIAIVLCSFTEFAQSNNVLAFSLLFFVWIAAISDNIPKKIVGDRIGFGFITTILATVCGVGLFGVIGTMLGVLLIIAVREIVLFSFDYLEEYDSSDNEMNGLREVEFDKSGQRIIVKT